jgi:hypothetical protein
MKTMILGAAVMTCLAAGPALRAQMPGPGRPGGPGMMMRGPGGPGGPGGARGADFLLGHTGQLQLTDAQVVRLAAVARRADARHRAMRVSMDSARRAMPAPRPDSASRRRMQRPSQAQMDAARKSMEQMRDSERADLRDAIAVLTPDQQAQAWEMVGHEGHGGPGRHGGPPMRMRSGGPDGPGGPGGPGRGSPGADK